MNILTAFAVLVALVHVQARDSYRDEIPNGYAVIDGDGGAWPGVGHFARNGGGARNPFGEDFDAQGRTWTNALCNMDSDGDGLTNGEELGDPECTWVKGAIPQFSIVTHPGFVDGVRQDAVRDSCENFTALPNSVLVNTTFPNYNVLPTSTTYAKLAFNLTEMKENDPSLDPEEPLYVTKFSPVIDQDQVTHHMLLYACTTAETVGFRAAPNVIGGMPCTEFLYAWAVGGGPFCFPENVAVAIDVTFDFLMLEIHYDNPTESSSFFDSSGLSMVASSTIDSEVQEAGYIWVGAPVNGAITIPPRRDYYEVSAACTAPPSVSQELNVFASIMHGHLITKKIFTVLDPGNASRPKEITTCKPYYDFDLQEAVPNDVYTITGGDKLTVHCIYDSSERDFVTTGGDATDDEMCIGIFFFYPKVPGTNCLGSSVVSQSGSVLDPTAVCTAAGAFILPSVSAPDWYLGHSLLMIVAWVVFNPVGIVVAMTQKGKGGSKWLVFHKASMLTGLLLMAAGVGIAAANITVHFASTHTYLGLLAIILAVVQILSGVTRPHLEEVKGRNRVFWEMSHQWTGRLAVGTAVGALYTGLGNYKLYSGGEIFERVGYGIVALFALGIIASIVYKLLLKSKPTKEVAAP